MGRGAITRRGLLAGGLSAVAGLALAEGVRPPARPTGPGPMAAPPAARPVARTEVAELIRRAGLEGRVGFVAVDVDSGTVLASHEAGAEFPPASVTKAATALYALDALGEEHRFATRLLATGPVEGGRLRGDLILAGGGDPELSTDRLAGLAMALAAAGVGEVGGFRVWGGALPQVREITAEQAPHLDYNPAVSGLNLNFNRVWFGWERQGAGYLLRMEALGEEHRPDVSLARMRVEERDLPVYTYARDGDLDLWTVARGRLGPAGSRWLPVRSPALYAGQAFVGLANEQGIVLPAPTVLAALPEGATEIARIEGDPLAEVARRMLLHSTNLTAEVLGLAASLARGEAVAGPAGSAAAMTRWLRGAVGARMRFVDHSGLGSGSRVAAGEMAAMLAAPGVMERLRPLLKDIPLTDAEGEALALPPGLVRAKTGTLNFVSALAGYERTLAGRDLAFAYLSGDLAARALAVDADGDDLPEGSREFLGRSRRLQQVLLQRWGLGAR
ncbi:D-alanyl-D-alanine carboxypeptidase/D-alanyl-D-alanine-endopeptidase [Rubellimicrobium aerolatum]|uniref:D-alanyl-D-alanine carboxypeptidase/D-alanyl-D-alanine-endopeptidase n=1 Tax=Rubellimicrobium aerolatum TaxID=490979 RepID=A0ABW0SAW4_9RHOB|nr:D-alanyl-D-alanine carboxypeptidase [Rubellimicrobium aerolatum]MBP1805390.1 D-alanyl-D-alanine carboxypeptidase/D-alanyl-D-alanine-endopeptidase (penicillin-binding protein 4) [Rubellimicrobium aerolatum]